MLARRRLRDFGKYLVDHIEVLDARLAVFGAGIGLKVGPAHDLGHADPELRRMGQMNHKRLAVAGDQRIDAGGLQPAALFRHIPAEQILGDAETDEADGCLQK